MNDKLIGINNIDGYTQNEIIGRQKLQNLFGEKLKIVEVEERSAPFDVSGSTFASSWYGEIKNRNVKSDSYSDDLLEYSKLKAMINTDPKGKHYYFVFFTDGICRVYNLSEIKIQDVFIANLECPASTVEPDKGTKMKLVYELPVALAKTYKY